jgi:hypothetical protein
MMCFFHNLCQLVLFIILSLSTCSASNNFSLTFNYTGSLQFYTIPTDGTINITMWGGGGAAGRASSWFGYNRGLRGGKGGAGGYTKCHRNVNAGDQLILSVGGGAQYNSGGYGGGGSGSGNGGGGRSHVLINGHDVAYAGGGGGGGGSKPNSYFPHGGAGGGLSGMTGSTYGGYGGT